jgi:hypothetical protein
MPTLFTIQKGGENSILSDDLMAAPHMVNPVVPESLSNFVMECTRINPKKRPADMGEVVRRLDILNYAIQRDTAQARKHGVA